VEVGVLLLLLGSSRASPTSRERVSRRWETATWLLRRAAPRGSTWCQELDASSAPTRAHWRCAPTRRRNPSRHWARPPKESPAWMN